MIFDVYYGMGYLMSNRVYTYLQTNSFVETIFGRKGAHLFAHS